MPKGETGSRCGSLVGVAFELSAHVVKESEMVRLKTIKCMRDFHVP
jgi:hypothetical protein